MSVRRPDQFPIGFAPGLAAGDGGELEGSAGFGCVDQVAGDLGVAVFVGGLVEGDVCVGHAWLLSAGLGTARPPAPWEPKILGEHETTQQAGSRAVD